MPERSIGLWPAREWAGTAQSKQNPGTMEAVPTAPAPPAPENAAAAGLPPRLWPPRSTGVGAVAAGLANLTIGRGRGTCNLGSPTFPLRSSGACDTERGTEVNIPGPPVATPAQQGH